MHKVLSEDSPAVIDMGRPGAFVVEKPSKSIPALRVHTHYVATIVCHAKRFMRFPAAPETLFVYTPIPGVLKRVTLCTATALESDTVAKLNPYT